MKSHILIKKFDLYVHFQTFPRGGYTPAVAKIPNKFTFALGKQLQFKSGV